MGDPPQSQLTALSPEFEAQMQKPNMDSMESQSPESQPPAWLSSPGGMYARLKRGMERPKP